MRGRSAHFPWLMHPAEGPSERLEFGFGDVLLHLRLFKEFHHLLHFSEGIPEKTSDVFDFLDGGADRNRRGGGY